MKFINAQSHGIIDYILVIFLFFSPSLIGFPEAIKNLPYILAGVHFLLTILTKFRLGAFKVIPFRLHGFIELLVGIAMIIFAFTYFTRDRVFETYYPSDLIAHNYYLFLGILILITWLCTDYKSS